MKIKGRICDICECSIKEEKAPWFSIKFPRCYKHQTFYFWADKVKDITRIDICDECMKKIIEQVKTNHKGGN